MKILLITLGLFLPLGLQAGLLDIFTKGTSSEYQHDADTVRLNDLHELWKLVLEYKARTGKFPLQGESEKPHYVEIATVQQQERLKGQPPYPIEKTSAKVFKALLRDELGREIDLPFDPQKVGASKPALYVYMITGDRFVLAIHVHEEFPFSKNVGRYYNKIEVSNEPYLPQRIFDGEELFSSEAYKKAMNRKMHKPVYFKELRAGIRKSGAF